MKITVNDALRRMKFGQSIENPGIIVSEFSEIYLQNYISNSFLGQKGSRRGHYIM